MDKHAIYDTTTISTTTFRPIRIASRIPPLAHRHVTGSSRFAAIHFPFSLRQYRQSRSLFVRKTAGFRCAFSPVSSFPFSQGGGKANIFVENDRYQTVISESLEF
jgi:hypothetical protein